MVDAATVKSPVSTTSDPLTGEDVTTYGAPIYGPAIKPHQGKCKVQGLDPLERNPEAGGAEVTVQRYRIDFPVGAFVPAVGQIVTITASRFDPFLVGRMFRVVSLLHKSFATAYRLGVEEVS